MLKGEKLTGEGVSGGTSGEGAETLESLQSEGFKEHDLNKVEEEMNNFQAKVSTLTNNATIKQAGSTLKRDMVVLVKLAKYDIDTDKYWTKF